MSKARYRHRVCFVSISLWPKTLWIFACHSCYLITVGPDKPFEFDLPQRDCACTLLQQEIGESNKLKASQGKGLVAPEMNSEWAPALDKIKRVHHCHGFGQKLLVAADAKLQPEKEDVHRDCR